MSLLPRNGLFQRISPLIQIKRFRGKINIQKPRAPHFEKATYLALTKPYFISPKKGMLQVDLCKGPGVTKKEQEENPFQRILARELYDMFVSSKLVAFYHLNPITAEQRFKAFASFKKQNMLFKNYGKKTLEMAIKGTPYERVLDFYVSHNIIVFSPEPELKKMLNIAKKFREIVLLAGIMDGRFLSKDELMHYSLIPNLQAAQSSLVQTLNNTACHLVTQLNTHQNTLVSHLQERTKQLEE